MVSTFQIKVDIVILNKKARPHDMLSIRNLFKYEDMDKLKVKG